MPTLPASLASVSATWALRETRADRCSFTGAGVKIALIDSGFYPSHPDFRARPIVAHSFVTDEDYGDRFGHGTHCGAIACGPKVPLQYPRYGIAGGAHMWVLKALGPGLTGATSQIKAAVRTAISYRCEIVCLPLGEVVGWGIPYEMSWELLAQEALAAGTLLLAAAGDESRRASGLRFPVDSPANCPSIVAVGAVDENLQTANFSNGGPNNNASGVDIVAPGVDIFSAYIEPAVYQVLSGTSQAVAFAAGIAALHAEKTGLRGAALKDELVRTARSLGLNAADAGAGLIQAPI
jgi:subtilisin family serine protease